MWGIIHQHSRVRKSILFVFTCVNPVNVLAQLSVKSTAPFKSRNTLYFSTLFPLVTWRLNLTFVHWNVINLRHCCLLNGMQWIHFIKLPPWLSWQLLWLNLKLLKLCKLALVITLWIQSMAHCIFQSVFGTSLHETHWEFMWNFIFSFFFSFKFGKQNTAQRGLILF